MATVSIPWMVILPVVEIRKKVEEEKMAMVLIKVVILIRWIMACIINSSHG